MLPLPRIMKPSPDVVQHFKCWIRLKWQAHMRCFMFWLSWESCLRDPVFGTFTDMSLNATVLFEGEEYRPPLD